MKVKKEYYIYPLLSLVSDFGLFPFLLDRAAQMGSSDLTRVWEGYILGYGAKMRHYPRAPIQAFKIDVSADGNY